MNQPMNQTCVADLSGQANQQDLLLSEFSHRIRNILQVVIAIANQTLHASQTLPQFEAAFMGRLLALSRSYELLSRERWRTAPLSEVLDSQLAAFSTGGCRYAAQGEEIVLTANAALAMGLVLYELATNAAKYGAFSSPQGRVDISWSVQRRDDPNAALVMQWCESGGPHVQPPCHEGFGSQLVRSQLQHELSGEVKMEFARQGLNVTLAIPMHNAVAVRPS